MNKDLTFNEFSANTLDDWKRKVMKELSGKTLESLDWNFENEFQVPPYFTEYQARYERVKRPTNDWLIGQCVTFRDNKKTNAQILECLMGGANSIDLSISENADVDFSILLKDVFLEYVQIQFTGKGVNTDLIHRFYSFLENSTIDISKTSGSFNSPSNDKLSDAEVADRILLFKKFKNKWRVFAVNANKIHNKGGSVLQSMTYALAEGKEIVARVVEHHEVPIDDASAMVYFSWATSSSYFPEIAKYRAFRTLWATIIRAFQPINDCSVHCYISAESSEYNQTYLDQYSNLLRTTSQAMSAIIGGADCCYVKNFNTLTESNSSEALRWARNILHLLREESYFNAIEDVSDGSYYIDYFVDQICESVWRKFQEIESAGGISKAWLSFQEQIENYKMIMEEELAFGTKVIVGVNKFSDMHQINAAKEEDFPKKDYFSKSLELALVGGKNED